MPDPVHLREDELQQQQRRIRACIRSRWQWGVCLALVTHLALVTTAILRNITRSLRPCHGQGRELVLSRKITRR